MGTLRFIKKMLTDLNLSVVDVNWKPLRQGQLVKLIKWDRKRKPASTEGKKR